MRRKRTSKRRWIARCRLGAAIPRWAIYAYKLDKRFSFTCLNLHAETYISQQQ